MAQSKKLFEIQRLPLEVQEEARARRIFLLNHGNVA
jgi:hypothetical protein